MKGLEDTDDRSFSTLANLVPHVSRQVSLRNLVSPPGNEAEGQEVKLSPRTGFRIGPQTSFRIGPQTGFLHGLFRPKIFAKFSRFITLSRKLPS